MANICDPRYPQPIEFIVDTECGRHFCISAVDYDSLIRSLHRDMYKPTFIMPYDEFLEQMENGRVYLERELKETA